MSTIAVLGAGAWGTALALVLARNGHTVRLWSYDPNQIQTIAKQRENQRYLPGVMFPETLHPESNIQNALEKADGVLIVVPSHAFSEVAEYAKPYITSTMALAWASKGLDTKTHSFLSDVIKSIFPGKGFSILSGPSFAAEVAAEKPTAITLASSDDASATFWQQALHNPHYFRVYLSKDIIGTQLGGALKNVLAIATGVASGLQLGANTQAALITRGLSEMMRLGIKMGAQPETFMGLTGMGDLILTCTDDQSRNRRFGRLIGEGKSISEAVAQINQVVEGIQATALIHALAQKLGVEMPITAQVYAVLYEHKSPLDAVTALVSRKPGTE
ncbi:MAG: NAD(P)H-dependent glycerol-3-phosphate dehydrogenase [Gammaproteobacteria bacterium]